MTTHKQVRSTEEALTLALEALENTYALRDDVIEAITAIKEALMSLQNGAQPAVAEQHKQEPIAKVCHDIEQHIGWNPSVNVAELPNGMHLYGSPQPKEPEQEPVAGRAIYEDGDVFERIAAMKKTPQRTWVNATTWRGLTDEEIEEIFNKSAGYGRDDFRSFARAIEAAHGIKGDTHE